MQEVEDNFLKVCDPFEPASNIYNERGNMDMIFHQEFDFLV